MITYNNLMPIFFTVPRDITSNDILPLLEYPYPKFYGGIVAVAALLDRRPDLVPEVKKESPEAFKAIKQFMEDFKENEAYTGSRYSNLFRQIFSKGMWPVHDPEGYTPLETMKANYLWYKALGENNVAAEYAIKYVAVKTMEDSLSGSSTN